METFIDHVVQIALLNNMDADNPYLMQFEQRYWVVVSYSEPTLIMPLNVVWIEGDSTSPDYKKARKRVSKTADAPFVNTWEDVVDLDHLKETQDWSNDDLPSGVFSPVHGNAGQLNFPITPRTGPYTNEEAIPKSEVNLLINTATSPIFQMYGSMNARVNVNKRDILELQQNLPDEEFYRLISDLVLQVTTNTDAISKAPKRRDFTVDDQQTFNTILDGQVTIVNAVLKKETGESIIPENVISIYDEDTEKTEVVVVFAYAVSGELSTIG